MPDALVLTSPATVVVDHPLPRAIVPPSSHTLPTSIRRDVLAAYLLHYDEHESTVLLNGFTNGFSLHYDGPHNFRTSGNHRSALQAQSVVDDKLLKEISFGRIAGPFTKPPFTDFHSSPRGLIPKLDLGKFRLIHDLSFPRGDSINFHTSKQFTSVQYETLDHVFFFRIPPSFNMLKIQAGEQEKSEYIYFFRFGCIAMYQNRNLCM